MTPDEFSVSQAKAAPLESLRAEAEDRVAAELKELKEVVVSLC